MRWRSLQVGRIYIRQHPGNDQLTVDELRDMVGRGEAFFNRVLYYAASLWGTRQYWFRQSRHLFSMVDTLELPTIFFKRSAADLQWPDLARLLCPHTSNDPPARVKAVNENPVITDGFFCHRMQKFLDAFYLGVLKVTDFWMRFEWQHHLMCMEWHNTPDVEQLLTLAKLPDSVRNEIIQYDDKTVTTLC